MELKDVREKQMLTRSGYLRAYGGYIPVAAFRERRHFFAAKVQLLRPEWHRRHLQDPTQLAAMVVLTAEIKLVRSSLVADISPTAWCTFLVTAM